MVEHVLTPKQCSCCNCVTEGTCKRKQENLAFCLQKKSYRKQSTHKMIHKQHISRQRDTQNTTWQRAWLCSALLLLPSHYEPAPHTASRLCATASPQPVSISRLFSFKARSAFSQCVPQMLDAMATAAVQSRAEREQRRAQQSQKRQQQ